MELNDTNENLFINLKQGNELNKYTQINKIEAIPHLTQLQKTSDVKLSNVDFNNNYDLLDNYKNVDDFKSYSQTKDLFNKSVSEYMLAKDYYIETKDSDLFLNCVKDSIKNITTWNTESDYQLNKIKLLLKDVKKFLNFIKTEFSFKEDYAFNRIYFWLEKETCAECIEYIVSIMM